MNREGHFMLARREDISEAEFRATLEKITEDVAGAGASSDWVTLVPAEALAALPHVAESGHARAADAILTVVGNDRSVADAVKMIGKSLNEISDLPHSRVTGGQRHPILPGTAPIRLFFGLRRLERLSRAEFQDYWLNVHADFGRRLIPPYTYHQIHAEEYLTGELTRLSGVPSSPLDGIVEVHFPDIDALIRQLMRPDVASEALADERNFIDHARSAFHVYSDPA